MNCARPFPISHFAKAKIEVAGAAIETLEPDWRNKLLALLSNPTLAVVLLMIGIYGLFVEFTSPGFGVPGVGGAIKERPQDFRVEEVPLYEPSGSGTTCAWFNDVRRVR